MSGKHFENCQHSAMFGPSSEIWSIINVRHRMVRNSRSGCKINKPKCNQQLRRQFIVVRKTRKARVITHAMLSCGISLLLPPAF